MVPCKLPWMVNKGSCILKFPNLGAAEKLSKILYWSITDSVYQGCKSQAWQIGPGRAVPARKFKWTGPGRSGSNFSWGGPGRAVFLRIFREDFSNIPQVFWKNKALLEWVNHKIEIFLKKSFKNTDKNKIGHDRPDPRFQLGRAGPLRPEIWLGRAGPDSPAQSGPKIYNPDLNIISYFEAISMFQDRIKLLRHNQI